MLSNEIFIDALTNCGACAVLVSEENEASEPTPSVRSKKKTKHSQSAVKRKKSRFEVVLGKTGKQHGEPIRLENPIESFWPMLVFWRFFLTAFAKARET